MVHLLLQAGVAIEVDDFARRNIVPYIPRPQVDITPICDIPTRSRGRLPYHAALVLTILWCLGGNPEAVAALKAAYRTSGLRGYWEKSLQLQEEKYRTESEKAQSEGKYVTILPLARLYARLGYIDKAFAALEFGVQKRDENMLFIKPESIRSTSPWASIRSDPRFADLLRRMGLER